MLISLNWLKKYVSVPVSDAELIKLIGARLVEVEGVIDETHKYDNIYIVRVEHAEKIPDTHLTRCMINNGGDELVQVLCGAPNVREGMLAVWLAPGAVVPASVHEDSPFVIGTRKMLGRYESHGMLAGADELDFGDDHSGIVEIDPAMAQPGEMLAEKFGLDDLVLEIENKSLTHRPDCFGIIGFAREVAGILGQKFEYQFEEAKVKVDNTIKIEIVGDEICGRYTAMKLEKHGEIKKKYLTWEDTVLSKSGMRPVDPIVDATNYLMLLTGQPLHAFDYDKFVAVGGGGQAKIVVRLARQGEELVLLDGRKIELCETDIVICSNDVPVALAGAMGGASTMIDRDTRNIMLEAAAFSLYNLRKTQMNHGIFSEAITRFTKGQPTYQTLATAEECARMLDRGFVVASVSDLVLDQEKEPTIKISADDINGLLGTEYDYAEIEQVLRNVGFEISCDCGKKNKCVCEKINVKAPKWRTDIHIKEDIIEEVGRLLGYDNIKPTLPRHSTAEQNAMWEFKMKLRRLMTGFGANELLTYSFVSERLLKKAGLDVENSYQIVNSISPDLQYVRQSIVPSLLEKAYVNQKIPYNEFALYEINKVYQKKEWGLDEEAVPVEKTRIGCVIAERKSTGTPYYKAKFYAEQILRELNISAKFLPLERKGAPALPFEPKRAAEIWVGNECIGVVGEFKNSVRRNFKLADYLAGFEIDMEMMLKSMGRKKVSDKFEVKDKQDLTVTTTQDYAEVYAEVQAKYPGAAITPVSIYQPDNKDEKNITLHLEFY